MLHQDRIYGSVEIAHPLILELMESPAVQRLKKINQYGPHHFRDKKLYVTRFEHSVGCAVLLQRFGAPVEAQAAGLLHDIAHSAFSHVADYVFGKHKTQDWHDGMFEKVVLKSDIPDILKRYGLGVEDVTKERWKIASQALPELSADKIDYGLRDSFIYGVTSAEDINYLLSNLVLEESEWCFKTVIAARMFAMKFNETCEKFWANPFWTVFKEKFAEIVKSALSSGTLLAEDLNSTDDVVLFKMMKDPASAAAIEKLIGLEITESDNDWDVHVTNKARVCNPKIVSGNHFLRLSEVDEEFKEKFDYVKYKVESGYFVKILN